MQFVCSVPRGLNQQGMCCGTVRQLWMFGGFVIKSSIRLNFRGQSSGMFGRL
jgi:hypothetical protein